MKITGLFVAVAASVATEEPHCDDHHGASFSSLMPEIMQMKLKLQAECQLRNTCSTQIPSTNAMAECVDGVVTVAPSAACPGGSITNCESTCPAENQLCLEECTSLCGLEKYPCHEMDLLSIVGSFDLGVGRDGNGLLHETSDIWGWVDQESGTEWALVGAQSGTSFVDLSDPIHPVVVAWLPTFEGTAPQPWRDIKVFKNFAYIVEDADIHGMQVFDLTRLRSLRQEFNVNGQERLTVKEDNHYAEFGSCHNIFVNHDSETLYAVGSDTCASGPHAIDVSDPLNPVFLGCASDDGYTHDLQCVMYAGPDAEFQGREVCALFNEDTLTLIDFTDKKKPELLARETYYGFVYSHQGWLTEDHRFVLLDDECDELVNQDPNGESPTAGTFPTARHGELSLGGIDYSHSYRGRADEDLSFTVMSNNFDADLTISNSVTVAVANGGCSRADWSGFPVGVAAIVERGLPGTECGLTIGGSVSNITFVDVIAEHAAASGATFVMIQNEDNEDARYRSFEPGLVNGIQYNGDMAIFAVTYALGEVVRGALDTPVIATVKAAEPRSDIDGNTITHIWDISSLRNIKKVGEFISPEAAVDHNQYVHGKYAVQSNYCSGVRILDLGNIAEVESGGAVEEVAWFDVEPRCNFAEFAGSWSNFVFPSGNIISTSTGLGLFTMKARLPDLVGVLV